MKVKKYKGFLLVNGPFIHWDFEEVAIEELTFMFHEHSGILVGVASYEGVAMAYLDNFVDDKYVLPKWPKLVTHIMECSKCGHRTEKE